MNLTNIDKITIENKNYRTVINTTKTMQLVLMSIPFNGEIGEEIHKNTTQFIKVEKGNGVAVIENKKYKITKGDFIMVPPGTKHNIISKSHRGLKLYTLYSPPEHKKNLTQNTKPL